MSYVCPKCSSPYSDLDVDRLFDPTDGSLRYAASIIDSAAQKHCVSLCLVTHTRGRSIIISCGCFVCSV